MKILMIGAGAIGSVTAAYMALGGIDVTLLCKRQSTAEAISREGLRITGVRGDRTVRFPAVWRLCQLEGPFDFCLIAVKAYDLEAAAREALPYLAPDGLMVTLQNGICLDRLYDAVGRDRAVGTVVSWSCTRRGEALMEITGEGGFLIGGPDGKEEARLLALRDAMEKMAPTRISANILSDMFSKLIINSGITCGGAMTGQTLGRMLTGVASRRFFIQIVKEDMAVAAAMGIRVPAFGSRLDYERFLRGDSLFGKVRRHAVLLAVGLKYRRLTSSSLTSLRSGGKTEVDYLNGWIAKMGREHKVPTPVNDQAVKIIKEIEAGGRKITPDNIRAAVS